MELTWRDVESAQLAASSELVHVTVFAHRLAIDGSDLLALNWLAALSANEAVGMKRGIVEIDLQ
jgi:hypothetical protein